MMHCAYQHKLYHVETGQRRQRHRRTRFLHPFAIISIANEYMFIYNVAAKNENGFFQSKFVGLEANPYDHPII